MFSNLEKQKNTIFGYIIRLQYKMKKVFILIILPFFLFAQNIKEYGFNNQQNNILSQNFIGCQDLDETLIDIVSIFGESTLLEGLLGCEELIPTLESGILSAFLPFEIPLDCGTDLTPFGYLDVNLSDICQCSCEPFLDIINLNNLKPNLIKKIDILGKNNNTKGLYFELYDDGTITKKYKLIQ